MLTNVIPELVRTLSQSETTSPGLLVLKKSSKSGLAVASITAPATDASLNTIIYVGNWYSIPILEHHASNVV